MLSCRRVGPRGLDIGQWHTCPPANTRSQVRLLVLKKKKRKERQDLAKCLVSKEAKIKALRTDWNKPNVKGPWTLSFKTPNFKTSITYPLKDYVHKYFAVDCWVRISINWICTHPKGLAIKNSLSKQSLIETLLLYQCTDDKEGGRGGKEKGKRVLHPHFYLFSKVL